MNAVLDFIAGLFSGDKLTPGNLRRAEKAVTQPHGDAAPRMNAAIKLADWGTPEAIATLLKRFDIQTPSGAVDLEEKREVQRLLVGLGDKAVDPILDYIPASREPNYPAHALEQILDEQQLTARVCDALDVLSTTYTRSQHGKVALIDLMASHPSPRVAQTVKPYLEDPNDDVCVAAVSCLARPEYEPEVREAFLELAASSSDRPRVRTRVLEALAELRWPVSGFRRRLEEDLPDEFSISREGLLKLRGQA